MPVYRMYFGIRGQRQIHGCEEFEAGDDAAAIRIACVLYDACSDACDYFELWQGEERPVYSRQGYRQGTRLADLIEAHQNVVIEREEHISQSHWLIAQSRRLIEALDHAKLAARVQRTSPASHQLPDANEADDGAATSWERENARRNLLMRRDC
jgi:hypothetical protein